MSTMAKQTKEYNHKIFATPEKVVEFLNENQEEIYIVNVTNTGDVYVVFYYKKIYK